MRANPVESANWEEPVGPKLEQGDHLPTLTLNLVGGGKVVLPDEIPNRYAALLFYRGHW